MRMVRMVRVMTVMRVVGRPARVLSKQRCPTRRGITRTFVRRLADAAGFYTAGEHRFANTSEQSQRLAVTAESDGLAFTACDVGQVGRGPSILPLAKTARVDVSLASVSASYDGWDDFGIIGHDGRSVYIRERIRYGCLEFGK